jgi:hypothetical protein
VKKELAMAIRNDPSDYEWATARNLRRGPVHHADDDDCGSMPVLSDTLMELAVAVAGFAGVVLVIYAVVHALR